MEKLELTILTFDNWAQPWTIRNFVMTNTSLDEISKLKFIEILDKAGKREYWNHPDLNLCYKTSYNFIKENYKLTDKAISTIVRAISYEWR